MTALGIKTLRDDLSFGARVAGVTRDLLADAAVRAEINALFEARGLIVFEDVEPSSDMHVAISNVFGPLKEHPVPGVARVDAKTLPGVIDMRHTPDEGGVVELDGKRLSQWLPWHFDHCYNNELNRAGVLRALEVPPEGGMTGFADGIDLYKAISPALRERVEGRHILYTLSLIYDDMRFGRPRGLKEITVKPGVRDVLNAAKGAARAVHPAVWTRGTGEKVLHVSPWMCEGIEGMENDAGDALLEALCQEINEKAQPYFHKWVPTEMLIWDNWRMLHCVSGHDPSHPRRMQRTTIKGDYGLGYFENNGVGDKILEMTV